MHTASQRTSPAHIFPNSIAFVPAGLCPFVNWVPRISSRPAMDGSAAHHQRRTLHAFAAPTGMRDIRGAKQLWAAQKRAPRRGTHGENGVVLCTFTQHSRQVEQSADGKERRYGSCIRAGSMQTGAGCASVRVTVFPVPPEKDTLCDESQLCTELQRQVEQYRHYEWRLNTIPASSSVQDASERIRRLIRRFGSRAKKDSTVDRTADSREIEGNLVRDSAELSRTLRRNSPSRSRGGATGNVSVRDLAALQNVSVQHILSVMLRGLLAREMLIQRHEPLIDSIVRKYGVNDMIRAELRQEATFGILRAAELFDASRGLQFCTYASHWVESYIFREFLCTFRGVRIPSHSYTAYRHHVAGRPVPGRRVSARTMLLTEQAMLACMSLDAPALSSWSFAADSAGNSSTSPPPTLISRLYGEEEHASEMLDACEVRSLRQGIDSVLPLVLSPREQRLIELRFGLKNGRAYSLQRVGAELHISSQRAWQLEKRALAKLRSAFGRLYT
ncbi:RNA polymerase sigma factor SigA [Porphyridium purpureum]|uniref:RNA polymerase sigma factor SigA n=1 Tax=Porphyridium purpureum TaxID=35688 RepID=A0A5J4YLM6_PORPP|nr:RNA polymerase sigma factor SigA [Porphyridium purpureum]|eukprot:POR6308..scf291_13